MDFDTKVVLVVVAILAASLVAYPFLNIEDATPVQEFKEIPRFESYEALKAAFGESNRMYGIMEDMMAFPAMATGVAQKSSESGVADGASDFSTTNIQVEGVDEADIVKTDGKFVYNFSKERLIITDAYPIDGSKIVSITEFSKFNPIEMFVLGDKALLFGNSYEDRVYNSEEPVSDQGFRAESMPYYGGDSFTVAKLFDISDRSNPKEIKEIKFEGNYLSSRLVGNNAYFVVNSWPRYWLEDDENIIPMMVEDGKLKRVAEPTEIGFIPPMPAESFITLVSLNLETQATEKETIAGSAHGVFASQDSIYLAGTAWFPPETLVPVGTPVIKDVERIIIGDTEKTIVNKFGLNNGKIGFLGQGAVPGHILNQFSMDEFEGNFRVATTIGWNGSNSLYVLNKDMETVGTLEDLAPGESIYSARFMGKKAYIVTFKKVDPLFVIDLSDPTNPYVLGKLKIPGYSDYLHPIDETHLIGIGKDTIEAAKGDFAWYQGIKMAIFDVSDVENPVEMHKLIIGDRGTESYALHDHKAFLFDREKELMVLPITLAEISDESKQGGIDRWPSYGENTFQGAFVFKVNLDEGFVERGRITHVTDEDELKRGYYYGSEYSVKRALYIGDVLYTLSEGLLKANSLSTLAELKEFSFE